MKVYKISVEKVGWDEFDSCIIVAENEEEVYTMLEHCENYTKVVINGKDTNIFFSDSQGKITIEEVDLTQSAIICTSFNAG